ncbi:Zn-Finger Containing protein [Lactiplantibacillus garii]|uniref:Zn-Finger Containing protein n=1 Tax=Lactiplantibacillus garii TaxID=2306423 RepID=A0A426D804_9LACO|nr:Zn-Finger Containing protein [Lactiplantibacillus garii]RRK10732.1 Zn-Finger Containing protein [Lactiplantibacillus garii]
MKPNSKMVRRLQTFMRGRYGQNDTLNRFLTNLALLLVIISFFIRSGWLVLIAVLLIVLSYWRLFSKKIYQQVAINRSFQRLWRPLTRPFSRLKYQLTQHWHYRFFSCEQCQQRIRIPKHHGRVRITCPKCGHQFEART